MPAGGWTSSPSSGPSPRCPSPVTTDLEGTYAEDASDHAVVEVNRLGRVASLAYKPEEPASSTVATEVFLYECDVLVEVLEELHREMAQKTEENQEGDSGLAEVTESVVFADTVGRESRVASVLAAGSRLAPGTTT